MYNTTQNPFIRGFLLWLKGVDVILANKINKLINLALVTMGIELLGCEYSSQGRRGLLRVYIDSEDGVTIDDCAKASKQISAILDVEDLITGKYALEVSSPGLDRPLFNMAHYQKYIGHQIKIRLKAPKGNRRNFTGVLTVVKNELIELEVDHQIITLAFSDIEKGNLIPEF